MDCSPPGSSVRGILQARKLEWVAISFSGRSSQGSNPRLLRLLHLWADSLLSESPGKPKLEINFSLYKNWGPIEKSFCVKDLYKVINFKEIFKA